MKTVTHLGKVYQVGALYLFKDEDGSGEIGRLTEVHDRLIQCFRSKSGNKNEWFKYCECVNEEIGTIEDTPLELEDGEWYMVYNRDEIETSPAKYTSGSWVFCEEAEAAGKCEWLTPLYKMVKA